MNSNNNITTLSYKELQALALRYRIPGNIKKKLLVKVLQAANGGNKDEVDRLLHDLRQTRKKRVRKLKPSKLGITSTPIHSPNYTVTDDYYLQQQLPYQWVAAEEEIANREDSNKIPHYEEFRQFLLRKIQQEIHTCDTNNNQVQESSIVDLRTVASSSDVYPILENINEYQSSNIVAGNEAEIYMYPSTEHVEYQILDDPNGNSQGSILLKKMLEAPVGADLGEIASPMPAGHHSWSAHEYQPTDALDNSDTLTADSEGNENENENDTKNNAQFYNVKGTYFVNTPNLVRNIEDVDRQVFNSATNENSCQQRYPYANVDANQNWTITNIRTVDTNSISNFSTLKVFDAIYCDNVDVKPTGEESANCQYRINENAYNENHNVLTLTSTKEYYSSNVIANVQADTDNVYYLQSIDKNSCGNQEDYLMNAEAIQESCVPGTEQSLSGNARYNADLSCQYPYNRSNQQLNVPLSENVVGLRGNEDYILGHESDVQKMSEAETIVRSSANDILSPFRPKFVPGRSSSGGNLENILNFCISTTPVDYAKIDQTSSVYCYTAPLVTQQLISSSTACSQSKKYVAETRQHSFSPYWLLYNDASSGMRMANLSRNIDDETVDVNENRAKPLHVKFVPAHSSDVKESVEETEEPLNDVWISNYANERVSVQKDIGIHQDSNLGEDAFFTGINTETNIP